MSTGERSLQPAWSCSNANLECDQGCVAKLASPSQLLNLCVAVVVLICPVRPRLAPAARPAGELVGVHLRVAWRSLSDSSQQMRAGGDAGLCGTEGLPVGPLHRLGVLQAANPYTVWASQHICSAKAVGELRCTSWFHASPSNIQDGSKSTKEASHLLGACMCRQASNVYTVVLSEHLLGEAQ